MIEVLESRIAPANLTWTGTGGTTLWSTATNWVTGGTGVPAVPSSGDSLTFDDTGIGGASINDTAAGSAYDLLFNSVNNAYSIGGNSISLISGLVVSGLSPVTVAMPLNGVGGVTMNSGLLTLTNPASSFVGDVVINGGTLMARGSATTVDPSSSSLGNPQVNAHDVTLNGGSLELGASDLFGIDGSTPLFRLNINGGVVSSAAGKFNTLGPILLDGTGVLTGSGGVSAAKQMYSLMGDVTALGGTISSNGTFAGYHLGSGVQIVAASGTLAISAPLINQTPAHGSLPGVLHVAGAGVVVLSGTNTFSGGTLLDDGTIRISRDANLGSPAGSVTMLGGSAIQTVGTFAIARNVSISGAVDFIIPTTNTLTISGVVSDGVPAGSISVSGGGKLLLSNPNNTISGSQSVTAGSLTFNGVTTSITGAGTATVTPIPGTTGIASIVLSGTTLTSVLKITGPATTEVFSISIPNANDHIDTIQLTNEILFGDGVADSTPDLFIAGKANRILMGDVNPNAIFKFGSGLPYEVPAETTTPDTYNNHPDITLRDLLGEGIVIDVLGDGTPGGVGGGGLGKFTVRSWGFPGLVKTTQSIDTFTIKRGDCFAVLEVDKFNNGVLTPANVNAITCLSGKWNSAGTAVEGYINKFDVGGFANAATLTAGYIQTRLLVKGTYLEPGNISLGGTITLTSESASSLFDIRIGSFAGTINAQGTVNKVTCTGNFSGTLIADGIVSKVSALQFVDNGFTNARITTTVSGIGSVVATAGGMTNTIIQSAGNIGAITLTGSGATRSMIGSTISAAGSITGAIKIGSTGSGANLIASVIVSGANLGADGLVGGSPDIWMPGTTIGNISIYGVMTGSSIAASIDPGADFLFGNPTVYGGNDVAVGGGGAIGKVSLHANAFTGKTIGTDNAISHTNAIMGASINGVFQLASTSKIAAAILNGAPDTARDLRVGGAVASDLLFFTF